jgi:acetyl-CoA synthetase
MLACARIGAPHSIVFGGFSAESLRDRMNDAQCKLLITADGGYRRGSIVPLRKVAFEALDGACVCDGCDRLQTADRLRRPGSGYLNRKPAA